MTVKTQKKMSPQEARDFLREPFANAGIKITPQRIEIFRTVHDTDEHPSAETIYEKLKEKMPSISIDTIYRTLATFEEMGLINRVSVLDRQSRFDAKMDKHHHFICLKCNRITDFHWPSFDEASLPSDLTDQGHVISRHIEVRGICSDCLKKEEG